MKIVIDIPEKVNNRLRSFLGHGYCIRDEDVKIIAEAIYNGQTELEAFEWCTDCKEYDQERYCCHRWTKVIRKTVEELKAYQRWIPVSERLPHGSCSDLVNVSIHDDSGDTPFDYTSCGWVTTDGEYWIVDNEINNHVIAWMPLPEPYKEGEDDQRRSNN